jgi:RecA/RadA recombinase
MSKWTKALRSYEDAVKFDYDAMAPENTIYSPSPYLNWTFANKSHGLPKGCGLLLFSEPKAGKSLTIQAFIQEMHRRDPNQIAIIFNTEMRGFVQTGFFEGINKENLIIYDSNRPEDVFDRFADDILPMLQEGMPVGLVAIDSITNIGGTKAEGRSVNDHLVGDKALTKSKGFDRMIPILKKYKIPYIGVEQMRMNVDTNNPHAPKEKMAADFKTKHIFEYFMSIKKAGGKDDKADIEGKLFEDDSMKDARDNKLRTGHKIYFKMESSSLGPDGRAGVLTIDYDKGIVNTHEEVFFLGYNTGVIKREGNSNYIYGDLKVNGKANFALKIKEDSKLSAAIMKEVLALDFKERT